MKNSVKRAQTWYRNKLRKCLRQNPKALKLLRRFRCFDSDKKPLARGLAVGLFFGLTPTIGFQTPLVLPSCLLLRANFPIAFMATWVSNPLTAAPLYFAFHWVGESMIGQTVMSESTTATHPWLSLFADESLQMAIGSLAFALPAAGAGYLLIMCLGPIRQSPNT